MAVSSKHYIIILSSGDCRLEAGAEEWSALVEMITCCFSFLRVAIYFLEFLKCPHVHGCTSRSLCCGSCLVFLWSEACMHESVSVLIQWNGKRQDSKSLPVLTSSPSWMASDGWNEELAHAQNAHEVCYRSGSFKAWSCGMKSKTPDQRRVLLASRVCAVLCDCYELVLALM